MSAVLTQQSEEVQEALHLERVGQFGQAAAILVECVSANPVDLHLLHALLRNLARKFETLRGQCPTDGELPTDLKRAWTNKNWSEVLLSVPRHLAKNPFHVPTLSAAADACADEGLFEQELAYLDFALQVVPNDLIVLRRNAKALADYQEFDKALDCWRRIESLLPNDDDAPRMITRLTVAEARETSGIGYQFDDMQAAASPTGGPPVARRVRQKRINATDAVTDEIQGANSKLRHVSMQKLEQDVRDFPAVAENYLRLAAIYLEKGRDYDAERLLAKGRTETGDDARIRYLWEDTRLTRLDAKIDLARKHVEVQDTPEKRAEVEELCRTREQLETEVFSNRAERDPENAVLHYELGLRLQQSGNQRTASIHFKRALHDPNQACAAAFELGECLRQSSQFHEALRYYRMAADAPAEPDQISCKTQALYWAGELAAQVKLFRLAQRYLTAAVRLNPHHREANALLRKIKG